MKDWTRISIGPSITVLYAMKAVNETATKLVVIVDEDKKLLVSLIDSEIRRASCKGRSR